MNLKIYVIEDQKSRRDKIKKYFESVNRLLIGLYDENRDLEGCHRCFQENGCTKVDLIEILPQELKETFCDYYLEKDSSILQEIRNVLEKKDEKRIFLMDLALNEEERKVFKDSQTAFRAKTAKTILSYINDNTQKKKEFVIIESTLNDLDERLYSAFDVDDFDGFKNIRHEAMLGSHFTGGQGVEDRVFGVSVAFANLLKYMKKEDKNEEL